MNLEKLIAHMTSEKEKDEQDKFVFTFRKKWKWKDYLTPNTVADRIQFIRLFSCGKYDKD